MDCFSVLCFLILLQQVYSNITSVEVYIGETIKGEEEDIILLKTNSVAVMNRRLSIISINNIPINPLLHTLNSPNGLRSSYEIIQLPLKKPNKGNKKCNSNRNYCSSRSSCCNTKGRRGGRSKYSCSSRKPRRCCSTSESSSCCESSTEESTSSSETETESESSEDDGRRKSKKSCRTVRSGCGCGCKIFTNYTVVGNNTNKQSYNEDESDSADDNDRTGSSADDHKTYKFDEEKDMALKNNLNANDYWSLQKKEYDQVIYRVKNDTIAFISNWWEKEEKSLVENLITAAIVKTNVQCYIGENIEERLFCFCFFNLILMNLFDNIFKLVTIKSNSKKIVQHKRSQDFNISEFKIESFISAGAII